MIPTFKEVQFHTHNLLEEMISWAEKEFDAAGEFRRGSYRITNRNTKRLGIAGWSRRDGASLKLNLGAVTQYVVQSYSEYASFNRRHDIGGFATEDWKLWVDALLAHEFSHVVQHFLYWRARDEGKRTVNVPGYIYGYVTADDGHGDLFQVVYGIFRKKYVNDRITARIGVTPYKTDFVIPEGQSTITERAEDKTHPHVGKSFYYKGLQYKVLSHLPAYPKYSMLCETANGRRTRFPQHDVTILISMNPQ